MKKKLLLIPLLIIILLLSATPVLAADPPPTTEVTIGVVSPGDVNATISLTGDNVNVTIDGYGMQATIDMAQAALDAANDKSGGAYGDWMYLFWRTGTFDDIQGWIADIWKTINLLVASQAKMIEKIEALEARIEVLENAQ